MLACWQETSEGSRLKWNKQRDTALLTQISAVGVRAFVTSKANTKDMPDDEKYNQGDAWNNSDDGILTMLKDSEHFVGVKWPAYQSVINHVTGPEGLLKKHSHLYTQGKEQDEPAPAGSERIHADSHVHEQLTLAEA